MIGVYEPIAVLFFDGTSRPTSLASEGDLSIESVVMHQECHRLEYGEAAHPVRGGW